MTRGRGLHRRQRPELLSLRSAPVPGLPTYLGAVVWSKLWLVRTVDERLIGGCPL